jgi:hypothetical protein
MHHRHACVCVFRKPRKPYHWSTRWIIASAPFPKPYLDWTSRLATSMVVARVARFFLAQTCQNGKNTPIDHKL